MAEEAAAARGEEEYDGAVTLHTENKTDGRDEALPRPHRALMEIVHLLARSGSPAPARLREEDRMLHKTALRAAIYARYSSDQQSAASIPDQVRLCRRLCEEQGWDVLEVFGDEAISGATHLRPGFQGMQQLAMAGGFDVLVAESLDRLSRDQEHIAGLHKRMGYLDIKIITKAEGEITELHVGLGGTMSAIFLRQLAQKTHRGLEGRVKAGKSAGGISYGYALDRQPLPGGSFTTGDRVIDPVEAAIVERIFTEYSRGLSARSIAIGLNRDGIPAPRAGVRAKAAGRSRRFRATGSAGRES